MKINRVQIVYPDAPWWQNWLVKTLTNLRFKHELRLIRRQYPQYDQFESEKMAALKTVRWWSER